VDRASSSAERRRLGAPVWELSQPSLERQRTHVGRAASQVNFATVDCSQTQAIGKKEPREGVASPRGMDVSEWTTAVALRCRVDAGKSAGTAAEARVTFDPVSGTVRWDGGTDLNLVSDVREIKIGGGDVGKRRDVSWCLMSAQLAKSCTLSRTRSLFSSSSSTKVA
jgi:hypothetical protein